MIRARIQDFGSVFKAHEVFPRLVGSDGAITHVGEWVLGDGSFPLSRSKKLFSSASKSADAVIAKRLLTSQQPASPFVGIAGSDLTKRLVLTEVIHKVATHLQKTRASSRLDVGSAGEIVVDELAEPAVSLFTLRDESDSCELVGERVVPIGNPFGGFGVERMPGQGCSDEVFDFQQHRFRLLLSHLAKTNRLPFPVVRNELNPASAV